MARPKEFEPVEALEKAMELFWLRGFEATSMQDLVDGMGISRASLYDTFGGKQELFLAAVKHYGEEVVCENLKVLDRPGSPLGRIRKLFASVGESACCDEGWRGCLLTNSVVERAPHDPHVQVMLKMLRDQMEEAFYRVLVEARDAGELPRGRRPRAMARYLTSLLQGLGVVARGQAGAQVVRDTLSVGLSVLN